MSSIASSSRPSKLSEVVGQGATLILSAFAAQPYASCWMLEGPPGVGKTSSALAMAAELGCDDDMSGLTVICCSELTVERARELLASIALRPLAGKWQLVVLEELERLSPQCQVFLKVALETALPPHAIVVATSNGSQGLQPALRERFSILEYAGGEQFSADGNERVRSLWAAETHGAELPAGRVDEKIAAVEVVDRPQLVCEEPAAMSTVSGAMQRKKRADAGVPYEPVVWARSQAKRLGVDYAVVLAKYRELRAAQRREQQTGGRKMPKDWETYREAVRDVERSVASRN